MRIVNASSREIERVAGFRWVLQFHLSLSPSLTPLFLFSPPPGRGIGDLQSFRNGWTLFTIGPRYKVKVIAAGARARPPGASSELRAHPASASRRPPALSLALSPFVVVVLVVIAGHCQGPRWSRANPVIRYTVCSRAREQRARGRPAETVPRVRTRSLAFPLFPSHHHRDPLTPLLIPRQDNFLSREMRATPEGGQSHEIYPLLHAD